MDDLHEETDGFLVLLERLVLLAGEVEDVGDLVEREDLGLLIEELLDLEGSLQEVYCLLVF